MMELRVAPAVLAATTAWAIREISDDAAPRRVVPVVLAATSVMMQSDPRVPSDARVPSEAPPASYIAESAAAEPLLPELAQRHGNAFG
jgi:hypothetical protein